MTRSNAYHSGILAIFALSMVTSSLAAEMTMTPDSIRFQPEQSAPAYQLRLALPDGRVLESTFLSNEVMQVTNAELGTHWADGSYRFEIWPVTGAEQRSGHHVDAGDHAKSSMAAESGSFRVLAGAFHLPGEGTAEPEGDIKALRDSVAQPKDQVIPDDLIVQGSACIGFDCVNAEDFGFDTLRLKENNLRIKFEDTSATAGFSTNDWQLTANDSASGGLDKFSIDDITNSRTPFTIVAGAPSNSVFVSSAGQVGFGTSTPVLDLQVLSGDTPAIRLEQNGSGGFAAQTWDVGGNEANFFVRDTTGGSRLVFRIFPGAPSNALTVAASGNIGMGTQSPAQKLELASASPVGIDLNNTAGARWRVMSGNRSAFTIMAPDDATTATELKLDTSGNLTIAGSLFANSTSFSDVPAQVLAPDYKLMPQDELAAFIEANRHLPKLAAKADGAKAGALNMTELQLRLLQKVEELTLYTLDQHRRIKALEQQVEELTRK